MISKKSIKRATKEQLRDMLTIDKELGPPSDMEVIERWLQRYRKGERVFYLPRAREPGYEPIPVFISDVVLCSETENEGFLAVSVSSSPTEKKPFHNYGMNENWLVLISDGYVALDYKEYINNIVRNTEEHILRVKGEIESLNNAWMKNKDANDDNDDGDELGEVNECDESSAEVLRIKQLMAGFFQEIDNVLLNNKDGRAGYSGVGGVVMAALCASIRSFCKGVYGDESMCVEFVGNYYSYPFAENADILCSRYILADFVGCGETCFSEGTEKKFAAFIHEGFGENFTTEKVDFDGTICKLDVNEFLIETRRAVALKLSEM